MQTEPEVPFRPFADVFAGFLAAHMPDMEVMPWQRDLIGRFYGDPVAGHLVPPVLATELLIDECPVYLAIPDELLMDYGAIPDTMPRKPVRLRTRLRCRLSQLRERAGERAYSVISGCEFPDQGDW